MLERARPQRLGALPHGRRPDASRATSPPSTPRSLRDLIARWWEEAEKYKVLPLDGSMQARLATERPQTSKPRTRFVYYPGGSVVPAFAAPPVYNRAVLDRGRRRDPGRRRRGRARRPGRRRRRLHLLREGRAALLPLQLRRPRPLRGAGRGRRPAARAATRCATSSSRPARRTSPTARACPGAASSTSTASSSARTEFPHTTPLFFELEGLSCGYDFGAPAARGYEPPFPFTGTIRQVAVDLAGELIADDEAEMRAPDGEAVMRRLRDRGDPAERATRCARSCSRSATTTGSRPTAASAPSRSTARRCGSATRS